MEPIGRALGPGYGGMVKLSGKGTAGKASGPGMLSMLKLGGGAAG